MLIQIVPRGKRWTRAFICCGGGYLAGNHISLLALTHVSGLRPDLPPLPGNDWATALNIRFQRGKDTVNNILASDRHGMLQLPCHLVTNVQKLQHRLIQILPNYARLWPVSSVEHAQGM